MKYSNVNSEVGAWRVSRSVKNKCYEAQQEASKLLVQGESNGAGPNISQSNTDHGWNHPGQVETKGRAKGQEEEEGPPSSHLQKQSYTYTASCYQQKHTQIWKNN